MRVCAAGDRALLSRRLVRGFSSLVFCKGAQPASRTSSDQVPIRLAVKPITVHAQRARSLKSSCAFSRGASSAGKASQRFQKGLRDTSADIGCGPGHGLRALCFRNLRILRKAIWPRSRTFYVCVKPALNKITVARLRGSCGSETSAAATAVDQYIRSSWKVSGSFSAVSSPRRVRRSFGGYGRLSACLIGVSRCSCAVEGMP